MGRGFNSVKKQSETFSVRSMKQSDYERVERLYQQDNSRTLNARRWFYTPAYCFGERRKAWEMQRRLDTTE